MTLDELATLKNDLIKIRNYEMSAIGKKKNPDWAKYGKTFRNYQQKIQFIDKQIKEKNGKINRQKD